MASRNGPCASPGPDGLPSRGSGRRRETTATDAAGPISHPEIRGLATGATGNLRDAYALKEFSEAEAAFVARAWNTGDGKKAIFYDGVTWLRTRKILFPGATNPDPAGHRPAR